MYSDAAEYKKVIEGQRKSEREDTNWTTLKRLKRLKSVLARTKKDLQGGPGIWAVKSQASQVPSHGPCQASLRRNFTRFSPDM